MERKRKISRYKRIHTQLDELLHRSPEPVACMATVGAVLHHKMDYFFWTGFYRLEDGSLTVGPYQGPLACQVLQKGKGVCWAAIDRKESILVPDVLTFPGHIPCDSRSKSEIVIPLMNRAGEPVGVLDVDSKQPDAFDGIDQQALENIVAMIYR